MEEISRPFPSFLEKYGISPERREIQLPANFSHWTDESLAKIMRIIVHIADSSRFILQSTREKDEKMICFDIPSKYLDLLSKALGEESRKEHRGIHLIPELLSFDLKLHQELPAIDTFNFKSLSIEDLEIKGFFPIASNYGCSLVTH